MSSEDKSWAHAQAYLLDPLTAPQPADETGPGSHFRPPTESSKALSGATTPPGRVNEGELKHHGPAELTSGYPSPPKSASPRKSPSSYRQEALGESSRRRRSSSLGERFPGDMSHRPLDQLTREKAKADKSRHQVKKHHIQPDGIDKLDKAAAGGAYHHGGPYDATLFARNNSYNSSPVAAVSSTNAETLKATPHERVVDSLQGHRPLDGVAEYAPGDQDLNGHVYNYEQGENMMTDVDPPGGAYKRWPGIDYHPDDIKGKGEPSYTIEKTLKDHKRSSSEKSNNMERNSIEMQNTHRRSGSGGAMREVFGDSQDGVKRSDSLSKRLGQGLKKRIGSIKKRHDE